MKTNIDSVDAAVNAQGFDTLSEGERDKLEKVLFLLDKFYVGDSFYDELTMLVDGLPKSYLIKQKREQLNQICQITSTPGEEEGAHLSFLKLLKDRIRNYLTNHPNFMNDDKPLRVKISRDSAQMTRNSNFILLSFSLLQASEDVMAAKGNHTIAVVRGKEDYEKMPQ